MRECAFYTCDPAWAERTLRAVQLQVHTHELQVSIESDLEWLTLREFSA